jgi:hypothetical protein
MGVPKKNSTRREKRRKKQQERSSLNFKRALEGESSEVTTREATPEDYERTGLKRPGSSSYC